MFSRLAVILSAALVALAAVTPTEPGPGDVDNQGAACDIAWTPDATGIWKTLNIQLMTGDNINMVHLTTVASNIDGTATPGTFSYPCPAVTPNSAIYFYQFSSPAQPTNLTWTGRFAIADPSGATVPPQNTTQPNGQPIPWGTGALADPSTAVPPPSYLPGGSNTTSPTSSTSANATSSVIPTTTGLSSTSITRASTTATSTTHSTSLLSASPAASSGATTANNNSAGGLVVGAASTHAALAGVSLAVIAATFTFLF